MDDFAYSDPDTTSGFFVVDYYPAGVKGPYYNSDQAVKEDPNQVQGKRKPKINAKMTDNPNYPDREFAPGKRVRL